MLSLNPCLQRDNFSCGPACARCVLDFFGLAKRGTSSATTPIDGTDPRTIEGFLRRAGLRLQSGEMTVADLKHHTEAMERPVIAAVTFDEEPHYVVVSGVRRGRVYLMDPWRGLVSLTASAFVASWWVGEDRFGARYQSFGIAAARE